MVPIGPRLVECVPALQGLSRVVFYGGLPADQRFLFVVGFTGVFGGGLLLLAIKLRAADGGAAADRELNSSLERRDLMEDGEPANALESVIQTANRWETYTLSILLSFTLAAVTVAAGLPRALFGLGLFCGMMFTLEACLKYGWPYVEAFYEDRQSDREARNPDSVKFEGFSVDTLILLTLTAGLFVAVMGLIAIEVLIA